MTVVAHCILETTLLYSMATTISSIAQLFVTHICTIELWVSFFHKWSVYSLMSQFGFWSAISVASRAAAYIAILISTALSYVKSFSKSKRFWIWVFPTPHTILSLSFSLSDALKLQWIESFFNCAMYSEILSPSFWSLLSNRNALPCWSVLGIIDCLLVLPLLRMFLSLACLEMLHHEAENIIFHQ